LGLSAGEVLEIVQQWSSPALLATILGFLLKHNLGVRAAKNAALQSYHAGEADIRDHYADELAALRAERAADAERYRRSLEAADRRSELCERQREELRDKVAALRELVESLKATIVQHSRSTAVALGDILSPDTKAAAERVEQIFARGEGET
jgi:hypothetical protein